MQLPKLKRVKVSTETELRTWLRKNASSPQEVMIVTCGKQSANKHISGEKVREAVRAFGWQPGRSYTLVGGLEGHVVKNA